MRIACEEIGDTYSASLWFWNGMITNAREVTGYLFSRDRSHALGPWGDHLGIGGNSGDENRLMFHCGDGQSEAIGGRTPLQRWHWHHIVFVRDGDRVRIHLDGKKTPELDLTTRDPTGRLAEQFFVGGRSDGKLSFEGRIDEVALFERALSGDEINALFRSAAGK